MNGQKDKEESTIASQCKNERNIKEKPKTTQLMWFEQQVGPLTSHYESDWEKNT